MNGTPWVQLDENCTAGTWAFALNLKSAKKLQRVLVPMRYAIDVAIKKLVGRSERRIYVINEAHMKKITLLIGILCVSCAPVFAVDLSKGTVVAGGSLTFPFEWRPALQSSLSIHAQPQLGVFFGDEWLLLGGVKLKTPLWESRQPLGERWRWGLNLGVLRYWDVEWAVKPFLGVMVDYEMRGIDFTTIEVGLLVPAGLSVPVSESVALEFGIVASVNFVGQPKIIESVRLDPGYLGVRVFL